MDGEGVGHTTVTLDNRDLSPEEARVIATLLTVLVNDADRATGQ